MRGSIRLIALVGVVVFFAVTNEGRADTSPEPDGSGWSGGDAFPPAPASEKAAKPTPKETAIDIWKRVRALMRGNQGQSTQTGSPPLIEPNIECSATKVQSCVAGILDGSVPVIVMAASASKSADGSKIPPITWDPKWLNNNGFPRAQPKLDPGKKDKRGRFHMEFPDALIESILNSLSTATIAIGTNQVFVSFNSADGDQLPYAFPELDIDLVAAIAYSLYVSEVERRLELLTNYAATASSSYAASAMDFGATVDDLNRSIIYWEALGSAVAGTAAIVALAPSAAAAWATLTATAVEAMPVAAPVVAFIAAFLPTVAGAEEVPLTSLQQNAHDRLMVKTQDFKLLIEDDITEDELEEVFAQVVAESRAALNHLRETAGSPDNYMTQARTFAEGAEDLVDEINRQFIEKHLGNIIPDRRKVTAHRESNKAKSGIFKFLENNLKEI